MTSQPFLQSLVEQFNAQSKSTTLHTKKCSDLKEEKHYSIHTMRKLDTTNGDAVLVTLSEAPFKVGDIPKFQMFLPRLFVILLQNMDLDSIQPGSLYIVSHGQSGANSTELSIHQSTM